MIPFHNVAAATVATALADTYFHAWRQHHESETNNERHQKRQSLDHGYHNLCSAFPGWKMHS